MSCNAPPYSAAVLQKLQHLIKICKNLFVFGNVASKYVMCYLNSAVVFFIQRIIVESDGILIQ